MQNEKVFVLVFASLLVLGACGNSDSSNEDDSDKKSETKSNDPNKDKDKSKDKDKKKEDKENLLMKRIKIAKNSHKNSKLTHKNNSRHNKRQLRNNKRNKTMSMIAQNTVTNTMPVTRFQLMTIGHQKKNNALNKVHNKVLKEMVMTLIIHI